MSSMIFYLQNLFVLSSFIFLIQKLLVLPLKNETKKSLGYPSNSLLNFTELSAKYGYPSEEHAVVTKDGYLLKMFRIIRSRNCQEEMKSPPVLLVHGFLQSSDSWMDAGPDAGLAFLIPDECHDLWVANCRGNYYSRAHIKLNPETDHEYWHFTSDEVGLYDLPAMIDHILHQTGSKKLNFVGFSQGAGSLLAMCSDLPDYCEKVQVMIGIAPATRLTHTRSVFLRLWSQGVMITEGLLNKFGMYEFLPKGGLMQELSEFLYQLSSASRLLVRAGQVLVDSYNPGSISEEAFSTFLGHFPAGSSLRSFARFGQATRSNNFQKYDFGMEGNLLAYGSSEPPKYNLSVVSVPVVIIYGEGDRLVDARDSKWLSTMLPNVLEEVAIADPLWNHMDCTCSQHTREFLFPKIKEYLDKFSFCT